ncbi:MAG: FMN-binding protein, partial [Kiloniellales bacterium]|nr:FMN-binding protein [Kiloniellales bacterium]
MAKRSMEPGKSADSRRVGPWPNICQVRGAAWELWLLFLLLSIAMIGQAQAADQLARLIKKAEVGELVPGAERLGPIEGAPPMAAAYRGDEVVGYVILNSDFANAVGYSGKPIHVLVGLDPNGVIVGAKLVEHHEPIVLIGIPEHKITAVIERYVGLDIPHLVRQTEADHKVDIVSGATVTIMVIDDSILRSGIKVARRLGLGGLEPEIERDSGPRMALDMSQGEPLDWQTLLGDGSLRRLIMNLADINAAFEESGDLVAAQSPETGPPEETFVELYAALVSIPTVGRSLLGDNEYRNLTKRLKPDQHAVLLTGGGRYSFKGSGYVRGGIFDRFQLIQGDNSIRFRDRDHKRLGSIAAAGAPDLPDVDLFRIPEKAIFEPTEAWRVELLVGRETGPTSKAYLTFDLG